MLQHGIIEESKSPWSSGVVLIKKPDGSWRSCVNYRKINTITVTENWSLPRINDILDKLSGLVWFSTIDLKSGYWQVLMDTDSKEYTAFSTPFGPELCSLLDF